MIKLLAVDDEMLVLVGLKSMLDWKSLGIEYAGTAHNGQQALEQIEQIKPEIVLIDINMPVKNGLEVAKECREKYGKLPVFIFLTSYEEFSFAKEAVSVQALDYLVKISLTPEQLDARILRDFSEVPNRAAGNILRGLLPASMVPVMLRRAGIPPEKKAHDITRAERLTLCNAIQKFELHPTAMRPISEAIITRGGVCVKEINPNTMESKLMRGLYFAGEVIDVDAFTGGYNLQIAFATAYAAAASVGGDSDA